MARRIRFAVGVTSLLTLALTVAGPGLAAAQSYPERPISMVVPWAAGGGTDRIARMVATLLEKELRTPVSVVNRTGGGGAIGHTAISTARPDGYTIGMATVEITMMHWLGLAQVKHADLTPVAQLNFDPAGVSVRSDARWKTIQELIEHVKANPGRLKASGTGRGGIWDLSRAGMLNALGLPENAVPWVPSEGAAPALTEVVAGGIDICTCSLVEAAPLIQAGRVKPLASMGEQRDPLFPDVPTLKEIGINWSMGAWRGITAPRGTPDPVVRTLEQALRKVYDSGEFQKFMKDQGFGIVWRGAADFGRFMADQDKTMGEVMRAVGLAK
jgi:tripartite-type tricarboxylate transporter receptor subunit TctC